MSGKGLQVRVITFGSRAPVVRFLAAGAALTLAAWGLGLTVTRIGASATGELSVDLLLAQHGALAGGWSLMTVGCLGSRRESTRSNSTAPTAHPTCSKAPTTNPCTSPKLPQPPGSKPLTTTRGPSTGPSLTNRSLAPSLDFHSELPGQDTSAQPQR